MKLAIEQYKEIADKYRAYIETGEPVKLYEYYTQHYVYNGTVVPKGRPRKGKGGRMYTPPETAKFEKAVKGWAEDNKMPKLKFPINVWLSIFDASEDEDLIQHGAAGLVYYSKNDLDNCAKSILDALNKVAYEDDRQIVGLHIGRGYAFVPGFRLTISRVGLSDNEYAQFKKFIKGDDE